MTTVYVPRLIESEEHAEALPAGTIAYTPGHDGRPVGTAHRLSHGDPIDAWDEGERTYTNSQMVGDVALVPVEVEIEHLRTHTGTTKTLYVTDWTQEEA